MRKGRVLSYIAPFTLKVIGFGLEGLCWTTSRVGAGSKQASRCERSAHTYLPQAHQFREVCEHAKCAVNGQYGRKGAPRIEPENGWNDRTSKTRLKARGPAEQISLVAAIAPTHICECDVARAGRPGRLRRRPVERRLLEQHSRRFSRYANHRHQLHGVQCHQLVRRAGGAICGDIRGRRAQRELDSLWRRCKCWSRND